MVVICRIYASSPRDKYFPVRPQSIRILSQDHRSLFFFLSSFSLVLAGHAGPHRSYNKNTHRIPILRTESQPNKNGLQAILIFCQHNEMSRLEGRPIYLKLRTFKSLVLSYAGIIIISIGQEYLRDTGSIERNILRVQAIGESSSDSHGYFNVIIHNN